MAARVTVSMLADGDVLGEAGRQVHKVRISPRENPLSWRKEEIVERTPANDLEQVHRAHSGNLVTGSSHYPISQLPNFPNRLFT